MIFIHLSFLVVLKSYLQHDAHVNVDSPTASVRRILKFFAGPQQAWASLTSSFESEIRPRIDEVRDKAKLVKGQAALAKAQDDSRRQAKFAAELQIREKGQPKMHLQLHLDH